MHGQPHIRFKELRFQFLTRNPGYFSLCISPHYFFFLPWRNSPSGPWPPHCRGFMITLIFTHRARKDSSRRVISQTQRSMPDNTQHSQETDIRASCGIRTRNPSKRSAADRHLRPSGHWCRQPTQCRLLITFIY